MDLNDDLNLTEKLFTRVKKVLETSEISNSSPVEEQDANLDETFIDGSMSSRWYRLLRRPTWAWQGADPVEVEQTLACIAMGKGERTHERYLDTIKGYVSGNWVYEWSQLAGRYFNQGRALVEQGDSAAALKDLLRAVRYYSIASYPHLKNDELADQAQLLGNMAYREAGRLFKVPLKEIQVPFRGKSIQGYLHLPTTDKPVPLVIVSGGIDSLQVDFLNLYLKCLEPNASSYTSSKGCLSNTTALPLRLADANARTSCSGQIKSFLCPILSIGTGVRVPSNPCVLRENTWHLVRSDSHWAASAPRRFASPSRIMRGQRANIS